MGAQKLESKIDLAPITKNFKPYLPYVIRTFYQIFCVSFDPVYIVCSFNCPFFFPYWIFCYQGSTLRHTMRQSHHCLWSLVSKDYYIVIREQEIWFNAITNGRIQQINTLDTVALVLGFGSGRPNRGYIVILVVL